MLHSFSLFRIAIMLENWHQMDGNWLDHKTYKYCAYEILPFLWFSMRLGMINSILIVCFTMVQKIFRSENIYKICAKISHNGYKTIFREKCVTFTINTREIFTTYFSRDFDRLSIYDVKVDWVLAKYNGYYRRESGKSGKYGFFCCLPETSNEVRCVFKFFHKI